MVSYPINIPSSPGIKSFKMSMVKSVNVSASQFTGHQEVKAFPGEWWECEVALPIMKRAAAEEWLAFFGLLKGPTYTFLIGDPDATTARGVATGTPLVDGANQTGSTLNLTGFTASTTAILKAGDYIQIDNNLYKVLQEANSSTDGDTTVEVFPRVRTAHDDASVVTVSSTKGKWRMKPGSLSWSSDEAGFYNINFEATEAF